MAFQIADRVKETTTTTGTGTLNLGGAVSQFQTFVAGIGNGNETYYSIEDPTGTDWEVGIGTVTDAATDTLSRDTVISSSNGGSLVNFGAGEKVVFSTQPASKTFILSSDNTAVISNINASTLTAGTLADARLSANVTLNNASTISTGTLSQDRLANSSITINGTGVALGGSINVGDITDVTAGDGLTGGGTTGAVTLNVGAGTGIDVTADAVAVDVSDFMTNGANNRVLTATGTDAMNAETNLTFDGSTLAVTGGATFTANVGLGDSNYINLGATQDLQIVHNHITGVSSVTDTNVGGTLNLQADNITLTGPVTATANVSLGDNDYLNIGASNDLQISHQGLDSYINEQGTGALYILSDGTGIFLKKGVAEDMAKFNTDGAVELYYDNSKKLETTSSGATVTGTITADGLTLGDNEKAQFGASNDLQIYKATGGNSYIQETGTSNLRVCGTEVFLRDGADTENLAVFRTNGANELYYDNSKKFETTAAGATVTGTLTGTQLAVSGAATFRDNTGQYGSIEITGGATTSWTGYSIEGQVVFMNNGSIGGIYNDIHNHWILKGTYNGATTIQYAGSDKLATTATGISVTGTVVESSSLAYKENVQPLQFNEAIYNVNAVKYDRKDGSSKDEVGVIAEELYKVLPDLVECKDGKPDAVKYTKMTMYLLEALKKQNQEIQELKRRLN